MKSESIINLVLYTYSTGTVHENIAYGLPDATREDVEIAAKQANCDFVWTLPQGFDTPIGRASLSGGQKQRSESPLYPLILRRAGRS